MLILAAAAAMDPHMFQRKANLFRKKRGRRRGEEEYEIERIADMVIAGLMALTGPSSIGAPSDQRF